MDNKSFTPRNNKLNISKKEFSKNHTEPKRIKIKVTCDHSVRDKNLFFTNYLDRKDLSNTINSQISKILKANGKEVSGDKIPFDIYDGDNDGEYYLMHNKDETRIPSILNLYNIKEFEEGEILKCYGKSGGIGHKIAGKGIPSDMVRVFVKEEVGSDVWDVLLIDPHHLIATEEYKSEYNKYKNYQYNINEIEDIY